MTKRLLIAAVVILGLTSIGILIGIVWARRHRNDSGPVHVSPLEDPRLAYTGPYRNIHPDVRYVGDAACVKCHKDETTTYKRHPMGRSMVAIGELAGALLLDSKHNNPFVFDGLTFDVVKEGDRIWHRRRRFDESGKLLYEFKQEVHYAIGSGARGYSYLSRTEDGFLFQTPISWYSQTKEWKISPGFGSAGYSPRVVHGQCVYCHANRAHFREDSWNRYDEPMFDGLAIGCERCHGPGEKHIRSKDRLDIVNPKRLKPALREAICQQCHLEGHPRILHRGRALEEFRPGLAVEDFWSVFAETGEHGEAKAVSQVEQMYQSRCFKGGTDERRLGCSTCHNPHVAVEPEERTSYYNERCLDCHQRRGCSKPRAERLKEQKDDSCIACHMPRRGSKDIPHTAFTDHRIVRRRGELVHAQGGQAVARGGPLLRSFNPAGIQFDPDETDRDRGVAMHYLASSADPDADPRMFGTFGLSLLDRALERDPDDMEARDARADFRRFMRNDLEGALADVEIILTKHPNREPVLAKAAALTSELATRERVQGDYRARSMDYYRRCVTVNPWNPDYRKFLVTLLIARGRFAEAWPHAERWVRLDPESIDARAAVVGCLAHLGKKAEAQTEFNKIIALRPPNLDALKDWFEDQLR
jgi:hypothetical protein